MEPGYHGTVIAISKQTQNPMFWAIRLLSLFVLDKNRAIESYCEFISKEQWRNAIEDSSPEGATPLMSSPSRRGSMQNDSTGPNF